MATSRLGAYIKEVNVRNSNGLDSLYGLSMSKEFRKSTSNIVGVDLSKYKVVKQNQFACDFMSPIRVNRLPVVINKTGEEIIVSPAYPVFEVINEGILDPNYLMLWFRRPEFDRHVVFQCDGGVRGGYGWKELCNEPIFVPDINKQKRIVESYLKIQKRIESNMETISKLERTIKSFFMIMCKSSKKNITLEDYCLIGSGKTQNDKSRKKDHLYKYPIAGASGIIGYTKNSNQTAPFITVGRVGSFGIVNIYTEDAWAADNVLTIRTDYIETVNQMLRKIDYEQIQKGGVQGLITQTDLKQVAVPSLDNDTILDFEKKSGEIRAYIRLLERENATLRSLVDALSSSTNNKIMEVA